MIRQVTVCSESAMRTARSTRCRICVGDGRHLNVLGGDVLEQRDEVDFLLVAAAERGARLLADDREDGRVVELGVVQAVEEMDRARPRGGEADADLAGELGVPARHERGHLLVAHLDQLGVTVCAVEARR